MDDSTLIELTKCFSMLANKHDGTFLKMWSEGGTVKFHLSNNNVRQPSFRHSTFFQHSISTPDRKLGEKADDKQLQRNEEGVVNEQNEDKQPEDGQAEQETDDEQQMQDAVQECGVESDKGILSTRVKFQEHVNSPDYPHIFNKYMAEFSKDIFSICENAGCGRCKINRICRSLNNDNDHIKFVCDTHRGSHWHK